MAEYGNGKRPIWQWVIIYLVIGGIIYGVIYYAFLKGDYSSTPQQQALQTVPSPSSQNTQNVSVEYSSQGFNPRTITIKAGQAVTWINKDTNPVEVSSNPHPTHTDYPPLNEVGLIQPGQSKSFTFPQAGKYGYHDHLDSTNFGEVIVN
ncbi:cupredoxin domain-containing protein [Candidatus Daviesbacteria bacterium]|nr:cupredoxin domain-containing protein [Candidatus Daviesbacteria bacterium]MBI4028883.1 cupredoxin domain-containing protein [Candidatus Blackburnbacteria bacterium]